MRARTIRTVTCAVAAFSPAAVSPAFGQTFWTAGTGNWNTPANWTLGVPNAGSGTAFDAVINNGGTAQLLAPPNGSVRRFRIGRTTGTGNVLVDAATLSVTENLFLNEGSAGTSSLTVRNGATVTSPSTILGQAGTHATNTLITGNGSKLNATTELVVGQSSTDWAFLKVEAGADVTSGTGTLAAGAGTIADATIRGVGSSWTTAGALTVGGAGTGILVVEDQGLVHVGTHLGINGFSVVNMNGGTLRFNTVTNANRINYFGGTIQLAGSRTLSQDATINTLYPPDLSGFRPIYRIPTQKGLTIEGTARIGSGSSHELHVNGGSFSVTSPGSELVIGELVNNSGAAHLVVTNGGVVRTANASLAVNANSQAEATVAGAGSTWNVLNSLTVGHSTSATAYVYVRDGGLLYLEDSATMTLRGLLYVDGGTVRLANYSPAVFGRFKFNYGTIQLSGNRNVGDADLAIGDIFGGTVNVTPGKTLVIEGAATLSEPATVDGGALTVGQLFNAPFLDLKRGTLTLTNQPVTVQSGGLFGDQLQLKPDVVINVNQGTTNRGLIWGNGTLGGAVLNDSAGEIRASAADSLAFKGAVTNSGEVRLIGGLVDLHSPLTNAAGGRITGRGTLIARAGLNNQGHVALSSGISDVYGDVVNNTSNPTVGITVSGQADVNFWGDVTNTNGLFRVSADASATFFGNFSGGGISGGGDVYFEADITPGSSPGLASFGGNVHFGPFASLEAEMAGAAAGTQYDQVQIAGDATLDGSLDLALINGYVPPPTQQFPLLTHATRAGTFDTISGYTISGGQAFAVHYTNTTTKAIAGQWHNPSLSGIIDVPGAKLDVTGSGTWSGTLLKRGGGVMEVQLGSSNVAPGSVLDVQDGSLLLKSNVGATNANLSLQITGNGSATFESTVHLAALDVADSRTATLAAGGERVIVTKSLNLNSSGTLDLTTNDLIVDYTGASPAASIEDWVRSAYNVTGDWQGDGITSSVAALDGNFVVAIADNALLAAPFGSAQGGPLFTGQDVDLTTVLVKFTHRADINLDGLVTPDDSAVFGGNYDEGQPATWATGDMNYDGVFTPDDAAIFGGAYDESLASLPEPTAVVSLAACALSLSRRRRR